MTMKMSLFFLLYIQLEKLTDLSNEFYTLIPFADYNIERTKAFEKEKDVEKWEEKLSDITQINDAFAILLGAQNRIKGMAYNSRPTKGVLIFLSLVKGKENNNI